MIKSIDTRMKTRKRSILHIAPVLDPDPPCRQRPDADLRTMPRPSETPAPPPPPPPGPIGRSPCWDRHSPAFFLPIPFPPILPGGCPTATATERAAAAPGAPMVSLFQSWKPRPRGTLATLGAALMPPGPRSHTSSLLRSYHPPRELPGAVESFPKVRRCHIHSTVHSPLGGCPGSRPTEGVIPPKVPLVTDIFRCQFPRIRGIPTPQATKLFI